MVRKGETLVDFHLRLAKKCDEAARAHLASISPDHSDTVRGNRMNSAGRELANAVRQRELAKSVV